ncbi:ras-related GTP binding D [Chytridium lagenaria]|nr:ras-related GTP binding D [Chytridium lagenaria]
MTNRCGKSSIQNVVFKKMSPNDTLFLETTTRVGKDDVISFLDFQVWDFPGHIDPHDPSFDATSTFSRCGAVVFIVDAQDDIFEAIKRLHATVTFAHEINPAISFDVLIHKVDGLSDDHKIETQREIHQRITDDLADAGLDDIHISFYLTSIYDHSIFEAFSKVIQKLIVQLPTLENLLNILCSNSGIEKAFLFDTFSKIYIATDSSPVDIQSYELCSDMIDVVMDFAMIYGTLKGDAGAANEETRPDAFTSIKLNNGMVLYTRQVDKNLSLVCLIREDNFEKKGLIDFNFGVFRKAVMDVLKIRKVGVAAFNASKEQSPVEANGKGLQGAGSYGSIY